MIIGKTDSQARQEEQEWVRKAARGIRSFALIPSKLMDGRWVWLQYHWKYLVVNELPHGYTRPLTGIYGEGYMWQRYLEPQDNPGNIRRG